MKLELCNFQVNEALFGSTTRWRDGVLEISRDELHSLVVGDPLVESAEIDLARPGESVRIASNIDIIEPRVKVQGNGKVYPGVYRRDGSMVGSGRTHRLGGTSVIVMAPPPASSTPGGGEGSGYGTGLAKSNSSISNELRANFIDMCGPGADTPYSELNNVCLIVRPVDGLDADEAMAVVQSAQLRVSDYLAEATVDVVPPDVEVIDLTPKPGLPGYVWVNSILSPEAQNGNPHSPRGAAVYGVTRLTQPWFLSPTEVLDGAVYGNAGAGLFPTWPLTNTIVLEMCRRHGTEFNFLGCIMVRTMWEEQWQKELMGEHAAFQAVSVGADGAVISPNARGQRMLDTVLIVQAFERAGIKSVLITEEEDNEEGNAPPLLAVSPEIVAIVSSGTGSSFGPYPAVERVIGNEDDLDSYLGELDPPHGRYGVSHLNDVFGFSKITSFEY